MSSFSDQVIGRLAETLDDETFAALFLRNRLGVASTTGYNECEDGWYVQWTTEPVQHSTTPGTNGKYLALIYKPVGKGSKSGRGKAREWELVTIRRCTTRREAKQIATREYYKHSPKLAAKHGRVS